MARLYPIEKEALKKAIEDIDGDVYLFGSRTNITKKGGDVDLLIINNSKTPNLKLSLEVSRKFRQICDEKIDVIVFSPKMNEEQSRFFRLIKKIPLGEIL